MKKLGRFKVISSSKSISHDKAHLKIGVNDLGNHFLVVNEDHEIQHVIDKVCNHAGGRLILKEGRAVCPMHGWQLDLKSLQYNDSHVCKPTIDYVETKGGEVVFEDYNRSLKNPFKKNKKGKIELRWLNHAAIHITCNGITLVTDPWLFGPAFMTGWWLANPSPDDAIALLKNADFVFLSHNHPDHLHAETLAVLPRDKKMIIPDFQSKSVEKYLKALGFENCRALGFNEIYELIEDFQISILKSGDFRDDSGIYICANGYEILLTVDAKFLNSHELPQQIDLLCTSFAGGASGFPLCFENFTQVHKDKILQRNRNSNLFMVQQYIEQSKPKYYMPYAGMFVEYAERDDYIYRHNKKNTVEKYEIICKQLEVELVYPKSNQMIVFENDHLRFQELKLSYLKRESPDFYIQKLKEEYNYDAQKIIHYLEKANYQGDQILQLIPTDDDFNQIVDLVIFADFKHQIFKTINAADLLTEKTGCRVMQMRIRPEVLMCVIDNKLPWEDISIGFQMRVERSPNEYESDFWFHFTNIYIGEKDFRYSSFCGACTVIDQNPIWVKSAL